jgi:hypothetical protein
LGPASIGWTARDVRLAHQGGIGALLEEQPAMPLSVGGLDHGEALQPKMLADHRQDAEVVLDHEHLGMASQSEDTDYSRVFR